MNTHTSGPAATNESARYVSVKGLQHLLDLGRTATYALIKEEGFPPPLVLGNRYRYPADEVAAWLENRREAQNRERAAATPAVTQPGATPAFNFRTAA